METIIILGHRSDRVQEDPQIRFLGLANLKVTIDQADYNPSLLYDLRHKQAMAEIALTFMQTAELAVSSKISLQSNFILVSARGNSTYRTLNSGNVWKTLGELERHGKMRASLG